MVFERIEIGKGINISAVKTDKFKTNLLTVNLLVPLSADTASLNSLLTDVLKQGTKSYPTMRALRRRQDELYSLGIGSYVQKKGELQAVTFELSSVDSGYVTDIDDFDGQAISLLRELIFEPATLDGCFLPEYVKREKKNLIDSIKSQIDNKKSYAIRRCQEVMCAGEPYAVNAAGDIPVVEAITPEQLYTHYKRLLTESAVEILYVGSREPAEIAALIKSTLPFPERRPPMLETIITPTSCEVKRVSEQMQINQCKLSIGLRTGITLKSGDYIKFSLFNELFGGSPTSKLFVNVREKKSLCYYCFPYVDGIKGIMVIASGVEQKNKDVAFDAIMEQLDDVRQGNFTESELEAAKRSLKNAYREINDSPASVMSWYLSRIICGRTDSPEEAALTVDSVTTKDISAMAARLTPDTVYVLES